MPKSKIVISIKKFRPVGAMTTMSVEMDLLDALPRPNPPPPNWAPTDGEVTKVGSYYLRSKRDNVPLDLEFWLVDDTGEFIDPTDRPDIAETKRWGRFRFLGISFSNRDQAAYLSKPPRGVGEHVFKTITIETKNAPNSPVNPAPEGCVLTVKNNRNYAAGAKESYDYMIFIQDTNSGDVGIIDPEYENEN